MINSVILKIFFITEDWYEKISITKKNFLTFTLAVIMVLSAVPASTKKASLME